MSILAKKAEKSENGAVALKRKRKWPYVMAGLALLLAAAVAVGLAQGHNAAVTISPTDTSLLIRTDLQDSISATGTVESARSMTVYSTKAYTVQEVLVEVGDRVEEGQLLCQLDDQNIQNQIETQQASLNTSTTSSNAAINSARDNYEQFKKSLENGTNASIISAENAVTNAENAYLTAQETYDRYVAGLEAGENATLLAQESTLRNARTAVDNAYKSYETALESLEDAEEAYEDAEDAWEDAEDTLYDAEEAVEELQEELEDLEDDISQLEKKIDTLEREIDAAADETAKVELQIQLGKANTDLDEMETDLLALQMRLVQAEGAQTAADTVMTQLDAALSQAEQACELAEKQIETCLDAITTAEENYQTVQKQYNAALTSVDNAVADYAKNVENAQKAYETAKASLAAAKVSAQNQLQAYQNSLNSAYASAGKDTMEVSLRQLQAELEGTRITAPMSGTVTAVYAEVGSAGSGLLFVIEDTENFVISTSVKDYDIATVEVGTLATIRSDATGDDLYEGEVTYIAPTASKTALGVTDTSGDISFDTDVAVHSDDTKLRIGLSVRLNLIVAEEKGVLAAPYDAIYTNGKGQTCVLLAEEQTDGTWLLREMIVETGLETDLDVAVKGEGLMEGMTVVSSPERYVSYIGQPVQIGTGSQQGLFGGM